MRTPWDPKGDPKETPMGLPWETHGNNKGKQRKPETHLTRFAKAWPGLPLGPSLDRHVVVRLVRSGWHTPTRL